MSIMNGCRILLFPARCFLVRHIDNFALPGISEKPVQANEPEILEPDPVSPSDEKGHFVCVASAVWIVCHFLQDNQTRVWTEPKKPYLDEPSVTGRDFLNESGAAYGSAIIDLDRFIIVSVTRPLEKERKESYRQRP
jgi:hypothetical protein